MMVGMLGLQGPIRSPNERLSATIRCDFDTAGHSGTVVKRLGLIAYRNHDTVADRALTAAFGAVIRPNLVPPATIGMLAYPGTVPPPSIGSHSGLKSPLGVLRVSVTRDGVPQDLLWELITYDPPTESEVVRQLTNASGTAELQSIGAAGDGGEVRLHLVWLPDSSDIVPLLRMRVAEIRIEQPVKYLNGPMPRYPIAQRERGIEGRVTLRYVVDESGKPVLSSMRVISASGQEFVDAAVTAVSRSRFRAGQTAGCPVPMLVEQVVRFMIGRGR